MAKRRRAGLKKIDTWEYRGGGARLAVDVYLEDREKTTGDRSGTAFRVDLPEYDISAWDTDIQKLKDEVFAQLRVRLQLDWKNYLYLQTHGNHEPWTATKGAEWLTFKDASASFSMSIHCVQLAELNGKKLWRGHPGSSYYGNQVQEGWPDEGEKKGRDRWLSDGMCTLIPDTEANRQALLRIMKGIEMLTDRLKDFLSPAKAQQALAAALQNTLLPAPQLALPSGEGHGDETGKGADAAGVRTSDGGKPAPGRARSKRHPR